MIMLKKLILISHSSIGVILILGYFGLNVLKGDIPSKSIVNVSLQSSIESFRNKFEQIHLIMQKRIANEVENFQAVQEIEKKIIEAMKEKDFKVVGKYLDKGFELLKVKIQEREGNINNFPLEKRIQQRLKLFNDTIIKKREIRKYNDKIGMALQRSVSLARAGNIDSAKGLIDIAMCMAKYGPIAIDENERDKLKEKLAIYYRSLDEKVFSYDLSRTLFLHDELIDALFFGTISYKEALTKLEKINLELENSKRLGKKSWEEEHIGKLISPKNSGCYVGTWSQDPFHLSPINQNLKMFEKSIEVDVAIDFFDFSYSPTNIDAPSQVIEFGPSALLLMKTAIADGTLPALQIHPIGDSLNETIFGKYDDEIVHSANVLKECDFPLMLEWLNEFDSEVATLAFGKDGRTSYLEIANSGLKVEYRKRKDIAFIPGFRKFNHDDPRLYNQYGDPSIPDGPERIRDTWRHIHDIFDQVGLSNITWFNHTAGFHGNEKIPQESPYYSAQPWNKMKYYYPGDNYMDWTGISGYSKFVGKSVDEWTIFGSAKPWYDEIKSSGWRNKPLFLHEFSQIPERYKSDLPLWIEKIFVEYIPKNFNSVHAFFWIINNLPLEEENEIKSFKKYITKNPYYVQKPQFNIDHIPPGQIKDLSAKIENGNIVLSWTAPGDDENKGEASYYIVKYRTDTVDNSGAILKDFRKEPWRLWSRYETNDVEGEPKPQKAGSKEKMVISGFKPGKYYFAIQSVDDVPYNSKISNVVEVIIK